MTLKHVVDTAVEAALQTIKNSVDKMDKHVNDLATDVGPRTAKQVLDFGKTLVGLKSKMEDKNIKTDVCMIDEAMHKIDTLPNDVGRQVQICKKTVADEIGKYIEKTDANFKSFTKEAAGIAEEAVKCLKATSLVCIGKVSLAVGAAAFKMPNGIAKQASDTLSLLNAFQERAVVCFTKAVDRTAKKAHGYLNVVEQCMRDKKILM
ncbi:unnamed protein product [Acanthoscelides obtectus]|nr:unnamed protein product [Acanthoscelides obtectus]CAK1651294.1 hypothetical protein AOBTE_LOCUS17160 [Acanthoscelides obtectus]